MPFTLSLGTLGVDVKAGGGEGLRSGASEGSLTNAGASLSFGRVVDTRSGAEVSSASALTEKLFNSWRVR